MRAVLVLTLMALAVMGQSQNPSTPATIRILSNTITPEPPLRANEPFHVVFNHSIIWYQYATDGTTVIPCAVTGGSTVPPAPNCFGDTSEYKLLINGNVTLSKQWTPAENGFVDFYMSAGLAVGSYSIVVQAIGSGGTTGTTAITLPVVQ